MGSYLGTVRTEAKPESERLRDIGVAAFRRNSPALGGQPAISRIVLGGKLECSVAHSLTIGLRRIFDLLATLAGLALSALTLDRDTT
jgi:hypothetical protein